jgi:dTDP-4-dehydrorhamnose reductase
MTLELWAGAECTVNRVRESYFDQVVRSGHHEREGDLDRLAALGVRRLRFPVLWERVAPESLTRPDFSWCDRRLERMRELGIAPIVGLVHHGSGPRYATLDSERFVAGLAEFAALVAERYPWVGAYTPVNEPLTTARFCGLYGHWYPHRRDTASFLAMLLAETRATAAAMERIRERAPHAQLIQTEDLGRTFSTAALAYQRTYENHRRWLSLDLLMGRVDRRHVMRRHLEENGIAPDALDALVARPCPPDIVGINYYVTSDRFLDERLDRYPTCTHGGNGRQRYADVEAVRVASERIAGHETVLKETFARYGRPVALTEVHLGCTREEQLRWLHEAWRAAETCAQQGVDVRGVTVWSAFGSFDWDSLLTRADGHYEPGLFDVRCSPPRPTALARTARALAEGQRVDHAALHGRGWWQERVRIVYPRSSPVPRAVARWRERGVLVVGEGLSCDVLSVLATARGLALQRASSLSAAFARLAGQRPWAIVLAAEPAERAAGAMPAAGAVAELARRCADSGVRFALCSSDRVFDGGADTPYVESDRVRARCAPGRALQRLEAALASRDQALIVRTGPLLDAVHSRCHARQLLNQPASDSVAFDEVVSPTLARHALDALLDLLIDAERGIWHLANRGAISLRALLALITGESREEARQERSRPTLRALGVGNAQPTAKRALGSERGWLLPSLEQAIAVYRAERAAAPRMQDGAA